MLFSQITPIDPLPYLHPTVYQVEQLLLQALPTPIPSSSYSNIICLNQSDIDETNKIVCPLKKGESGFHALYMGIALAINGLSINSIGLDRDEGSVSDIVNTFFKYVLEGYASHFKLNVHFDYNKSCSVLTTCRSVQTRRDGICYIYDVPFFIEEIKENIEDESDAKKQLDENTGMMSAQFYGEVPFVVSCSVAGPIVKLLGYFRKGKKLKHLIDLL